MIIIGLTGSIATGKTTIARMFHSEGVPVHDADSAVHDLLSAKGAASAPVGEMFPEAVRPDGGIDRPTLGKLVFEDGPLRQKLEQILHPLVRAERDEWLASQRTAKAPFVVLDVPLLFETGGEKDCDVTLVVSCSPYLQRLRALQRPNMTEERLNAILNLQMPDDLKRQKADFIIPTDFGQTASLWHILKILAILKARKKGRTK